MLLLLLLLKCFFYYCWWQSIPVVLSDFKFHCNGHCSCCWTCTFNTAASFAPLLVWFDLDVVLIPRTTFIIFSLTSWRGRGQVCVFSWLKSRLPISSFLGQLSLSAFCWFSSAPQVLVLLLLFCVS